MTAIGGIIGDFTPDNKRGRAFGIVEFSYSLSDFFIPLIGLSLQYWPVNVIYYVQGMIAFVVAAGLLWRFPRRAKRAVSLSSRIVPFSDVKSHEQSLVLESTERL